MSSNQNKQGWVQAFQYYHHILWFIYEKCLLAKSNCYIRLLISTRLRMRISWTLACMNFIYSNNFVLEVNGTNNDGTADKCAKWKTLALRIEFPNWGTFFPNSFRNNLIYIYWHCEYLNWILDSRDWCSDRVISITARTADKATAITIARLAIRVLHSFHFLLYSFSSTQ